MALRGEGKGQDSGWVRGRESVFPFNSSLPGHLTLRLVPPGTPKPESYFQVALEKPRCVHGGGGTCTLLPLATNPIRYHHRDPSLYSRHPDLANGGRVSIQNEGCCVRSHRRLGGSPGGALGRGCPCVNPLGLAHEMTVVRS